MVVRGGWPEERLREASDAQIVVRDYLEAFFVQSVPRLGGNEGVARRLALSLARNLGQSAKVNTFACDVYAHESAGEVSIPSAKKRHRISIYFVGSFLLTRFQDGFPPLALLNECA